VREGRLGCRAGSSAVAKDEAVAVRGEDERDVEGRSVVERLLQAGADAMGVVLGLDDRDRDVRLVVEDVVGAVGPATGDQLAADDDASW